MALSAVIEADRVSSALCDQPPSGAGHNDAFSFWKLPHDWKSALESTIAESKVVAEYYLFEEYLAREDRPPPSRMQAYYRIKNLIPAVLRHRLNSAAVRMRGRRDFPHWPFETALTDYWRDWMQLSLRSVNATDGWHIGFWPDGLKCCIVLTHDVEGPLGMSRMERMADLEERYNFRSAWNLPLAQYEIDWKLIDRLRLRGFEFGAHGLCHDGRLFRSESDFSALAPILQELAHSHGLKRLPRAFDAAARRMDRQTLLRLRLQLLGFGSLRAATGRDLQRVSFFPRKPGRAALHDAAGSHADSSAAPESHTDLGDRRHDGSNRSAG